MFYLAKILFAETEQCRAIKLGVAADVIISVWMELAAVRVAPKFFRVVAATCIHLQRVPIFFLARNKWPALQQQNLLATRSEVVRQSAAARARTDDNKIVVAPVVHADWSRGAQNPYAMLLLFVSLAKLPACRNDLETTIVVFVRSDLLLT